MPIHDILWEDGLLCYSMKLVNGRTLQAILNDLRHGQNEGYSLDRLLLARKSHTPES